MNLKLTTTLLLILGAFAASSQIILITEKATGDPIEHVVIFSEEPKAFVTTNAEGKAQISAFRNAEKILIQTFGFQTMHTSYTKLDSANFKVQLIPSVFNVTEVVISATRAQQSKEDVPAKITTISQKEMMLSQPQTAADVLGSSGDVFIQKSQQGGGSPMIRGFATNRLLYTVDGVRMNSAIFRSGNIQNVINIDPFAVEQAEILFGGSSVIYGSDAIGGVMSFQTLTPQLSLEDKTLISGKANSRYSSANNEQTFHFDVNVGLKKWSFLTSFSHWNFDHLEQGRYGPEEYLRTSYVQRIDSMDIVVDQENDRLQIPSGYQQSNLMQKIRFKPNENWDFQYGFHYSETSDYGRYDRHNRVRNGTWRYGEWDYGPQSWMMNHLSIENSGKTKLFDQMGINIAHQQFQESRISRNFNADERQIRAEEVQAYSVNLDFNKSIAKKNHLYYGAEWILNDVDSEGENQDIARASSIPGPSRYPDAIWQSAAAYLNNDYKASKKLTVVAGARWNLFSASTVFDTTFYNFQSTSSFSQNSAITGNIGFVYEPAESWVLSMNANTAFRAPNVDDIGKVFDSEPGAVVVPNTGLDAEYAYNIDIGIAKKVKEWAQFEVNGYYTYLDNALVRRDFTLNGSDSLLYDGVMSKVQAIQNAAFAEVLGWQLFAVFKFSETLKWETRLNGQYGVEETDDGTTTPMRHAAPIFGKSALLYQFKKLRLEINVIGQGERKFENLNIGEQGKDEIYAKDENGNNYAPAWYTLNFKGALEISKQWMVTAGIENITDQRYRPYSSGLSGAGRNLIFALQMKF